MGAADTEESQGPGQTEMLCEILSDKPTLTINQEKDEQTKKKAKK